MDDRGLRAATPRHAWRWRPLLTAAGLVAAVAGGGMLIGSGSLRAGHSGDATGASPGPSVRHGAAMAWDPATGSVLLFGGRNTGGLDDTWSWDGTRWHRLFPRSSPPPRSDAVMAQDGHGGLVLYGGFGDPLDGGRSICVRPRGAEVLPIPHVSADRALVECELGGPPLGDTWTWDGRTWTQRFPAHSLATPWRPNQMAFDSANRVAVMVVPMAPPGYVPGQSGCPGHPPAPTCPAPLPVDTLWQWTGSDWIPMPAVAGPTSGVASDPTRGLLAAAARTRDQPERFGAALAVDEAHGEVVLFGGAANGSLDQRLSAETWTWDGARWTRVAGTVTPG